MLGKFRKPQGKSKNKRSLDCAEEIFMMITPLVLELSQPEYIRDKQGDPQPCMAED